MNRIWLLAITLAVAGFALPSWGERTRDASDLVDVESVIKNVKQALAAAQDELEAERLPSVKAVQLQFETVYSTGSTGRSQLFIPKVGTPFQRAVSHKLTLDLKPPQARSEPVSVRDLEENLTEAIVAAASAAQVVSSEPTPLARTGAAAHLRFVVRKSGAGGLGYAIAPISAELDARLDQAAVQFLIVTFSDS